jgi:PmbA protein
MDDDGIPTQRQALVTRGVLQKFLYDLDSARLAAAAPTGNSNCAPYYLEMQPGTRPSSELLRGIDDGLYLTENFIGFGQSNMLNGDFACNLGLGYRIEKGEIVGRVKNTMISGNLYELLDGTVELSSDLDFEGSLPSAVIEGVSVSA